MLPHLRVDLLPLIKLFHTSLLNFLMVLLLASLVLSKWAGQRRYLEVDLIGSKETNQKQEKRCLVLGWDLTQDLSVLNVLPTSEPTHLFNLPYNVSLYIYSDGLI